MAEPKRPVSWPVRLGWLVRIWAASVLGHIHWAVAMQHDGRLESPLYVQFVMGVRNAMPVDRDVFDYYLRMMARLAPDAEWCAAGIGPHQLTLNEWCVAEGGHALGLAPVAAKATA